MNIEDKIVLSKDWQNIYFFTEGIFAQLFGVSLYLAIEKMGLSLKVCGYRYKKLNSELILRAGLPTKILEQRYGDILLKRDFGYELSYDALQSDLSQEIENYHQWYEAHLAYILTQEQSQANSKTATKKMPSVKQKQIAEPETEVEKANAKALNGYITSEGQVAAEPKGTRHLPLSESEYLFLKNWQQDIYPTSIESGFIRGLQQKIAGSGA